MLSDDERRLYPRADVAIKVEYSVEARYEVSGATRDFSTGGISLETVEAHAPGTELDFRFHLEPGRPPIRARGRVVRHWVSEDGKVFSAVQFSDIDDMDLLNIMERIKAESA